MAVAAYGSVLSLLRVLDNVQHPSRLRHFPDPTRVVALREKLSFLQDFLENSSSTIAEDMECILRKIPQVTYEAEISIDNYVVDQLNNGESKPRDDVMRCNIDDEIYRAMQEIALVNEALMTRTQRTTQRDDEEELRFFNKIAGNKPTNNDRSLKSFGQKEKMVGFDDRLKQVLEKLASNKSNLVILPIVGMGGIGKTTLARSLFDHPYNLHHFHVRIWLTISQDYSVKNVLQGLLNDGVLLGDEEGRESGGETEAKLITKLHQKLFGQRYLIVLDDVWSSKAWEDLRRGFPDNGKRSRVVVTTRMSDIANSLATHDNVYSMDLLDEDKSWDLFSGKAFENGGRRSLQLEKIGRKISKRCNGLPLLLVVVGGLLANSETTVQYWQTVAEDINLFSSSMTDDYCLRVLSLSYNHLPIHLKPCFLFMSNAPEDGDVNVCRLIEKWVSQGFVKPMRGKSLEEAARRYLEDLVGRNMLLIRERSENGDVKTCAVHDLLRDLSIKESAKEKFLELPKTVLMSVLDIYGHCALCHGRKPDMKTFNSRILGPTFDGGRILMCSYCESMLPEIARSRFVVAVKMHSQNVPLPMMTTYRWIQLYHSVYAPASNKLRLFWNFEILHITGVGCVIALPKKIWEMPQIRHLRAEGMKLPDPLSTKNDAATVLENLHTLMTIVQFECTEEVVRRIPNLRKLCLRYENVLKEEEGWSRFHLQNLSHLQKLESLFIGCFKVSSSLDFDAISFPRSLKELTLLSCGIISWDDMTIIGSLPNLEVLKLLTRSVLGEEWNLIEGGELFLRLRYLKLQRLNLVQWSVDHETHFPALETLFLDNMRALVEIPREVGELPSLNTIYLRRCKEHIVDSARVVVEEQRSNGTEEPVVRVMGRNGQWRLIE